MTLNSLQQITVPFHNAELYIVEYEGQPYTPMKPIVDGMGLDWASQFVKLKQRFAKGIVEIAIPSKGGLQTMLCLMLRKLPAWLYSVNANKVKAELRPTVIMYQEECDDVLWDYWTKGKAVNPRPKTPKTKHLNFSEAYKIVHQRFNVDHIEDIPYEAIPVAVEYVHHLIALYSSAGKQGGLFDKDTYELVRELTEAILSQNGMMNNVWKALELIAPDSISYYAQYITGSNVLARKVSMELDFKTRRGEPLIDQYCRTINFVGGHRMGINPKWFNAPAW